MCQPLAPKKQQSPLLQGMSEQGRKSKYLSQWTPSEGIWKSFSISQGVLMPNCSTSLSTKIK